VIYRGHHLQEERLFDSYLAERSGTPIDPPVAEHLADCRQCEAQYADLVDCMDTIRAQGDAEAAELLTPERLRLQHQQILRPIEHARLAARVIDLPGQFGPRTMTALNRLPDPL